MIRLRPSPSEAHIHSDDSPVGRVPTRRKALAVLGVAGGRVSRTPGSTRWGSSCSTGNQITDAAKGERRNRNSGDKIFVRGGDRLLLDPATGDGHAAGFDIGLQVT